MDTEPIFLTLAEVLEIHKNQRENYGGHQEGIRDISLMGVASGKKKKDYLASIFRELSIRE